MRPPHGLGHYLRDVVGGANDGVITTMAVIAGVAGASLPPNVALVLGAANLVADGFSMGASGYLALKSELEQTGASVEHEQPIRHGVATLVAFVLAGAIPLLAFLVGDPDQRLWIAAGLSALTLGAVGAARSSFVRRPAWQCGAEMVLVGGIAAAMAWVMGWAVSFIV